MSSSRARRLQLEKQKHVEPTEPVRRQIPLIHARQMFTATWQFCNVLMSVGRDTIHIAELFADDGEILVNIKTSEIKPYLQVLSMACQFGLLEQIGFMIRVHEKVLRFIAVNQKEFNTPGMTIERQVKLLNEFFVNDDVMMPEPEPAEETPDVE